MDFPHDAVDGWWWRRGVAAVQQEQPLDVALRARRVQDVAAIVVDPTRIGTLVSQQMGELAVAVGLWVREVRMIGGERPLIALLQRPQSEPGRLLKQDHKQFRLEARELRRGRAEQCPNLLRIS